MIIDSPYPGLRPFDRDEAHLFFGREEQTDELLRRLQQTRFLAVVGPSGCGKSSLVRAGMVAALETGFMVEAGSRWEFAVMRPGGRPIQRLATALLENTSLSPPDSAEMADALGFLTASLRRGPLGLVEALQITPLAPETNLLILVDQFEEIFRFRREGGAEEADAFVSLLLETARQRETPVYVVITMRSDFFGHCAVFAGLPEVINESQFLTPRLSREQREAAIVGPARVYGSDVEPTLVCRLLNEMGSDPDQLPIMQHLLMRMWTYREASATSAAERLGGDALARVLTLHDYEQVGGLRHALSKHADEAYGSLTEEQKRLAELMFRRLSERGQDQLDVRRPTHAGVIAGLCGVAIDEVVAVVDVFRAPGVSFLMPAWPEPIEASNILDISHESLIRQWDRLQGWAHKEAESAERYRFLEQTARRWRDGEAALWGTPNLELALDWRQCERPTAAWAEGYGGDFALAMEFLDASEHARLERQAQEKARRDRQVRRLRYATAALASSLVAFGGVLLWYLDGFVWEHAAYYNTFTKRHGVAEGIGRLTQNQVRQRPVSLKITREGQHGPVLRVEAVDSRDRCTPQHSIDTYFDTTEVYSPLRECAWEFVQRDEEVVYEDIGAFLRAWAGLRRKREIVYEMAYDKSARLVWGLAYTPGRAFMRNGAEAGRSAYYLGPDGYPQPRKNSAAAIVDITYSHDGYEMRHVYWDWDREKGPQPGLDKAFGREMQYHPGGLVRVYASLDHDQTSWMNDTAGNATLELVYDELGNVIEAIALDKDNNPVYVKPGWHKFKAVYDENGNRIEFGFFDKNDRAISSSDGFHLSRLKYDGGNLTEQTYFDVHGRPASINGHHKEVMKYDDAGRINEITYFDASDEAAVDVDGYHRLRLGYDQDGNIIEWRYFGVSDQAVLTNSGYHQEKAAYDVRGNKIRSTYYDQNGGRIQLPEGYNEVRWTYDERGNQATAAYFDMNGRATLHRDGYQEIRWTYDSSGNQLTKAYFDINRQPVRYDGHHEIRWTYDQRGNQLTEAYFDEKGQPTERLNAPHKIVRSYDSRDNKITEAYLDLDGQPALHKDGYHRWTTEYDERDKNIVEAYFGQDGDLITCAQCGYAIRRSEYEDGRLVEEAFYGPDDQLLLHPEHGYAMARLRYDERGNLLQVAFFGTDEKPMLHSEYGYAIRRTKYDEGGREIEEAYYGPDEKLLLHSEHGYAVRRSRYDESGYLTEQKFYGAGGNAIHKQYDERGNEIASAYFDADGRPAVFADGYHRLTNEYDDRGNVIASAYFDADRRPAVHANGYHSLSIAYDDAGNQIERTYHDEAGNVLDAMTKIIDVVTDSQADLLGLQAGDIILRYNGKDIDDVAEFVHETAIEQGPQRELIIRRDRQTLTFQVEPGRLGVEVSDVVPQLHERSALLPAAE